MGHNLGMSHDKPTCTCGANKCIMYPSVSSDVPLKFSDCSIGDLRNFIYDSYPDCLLNVPISSQILSPAVCSNKFTESGEQCDCGECTDTCCDPYTCKLKPGYECSEGACCHKCKVSA
ncbi:unnamed protein product [Staurois parvus]|uniref:Uncharacterized protein n=1 Tax=Staurois parvus TaxID=386267 RepID=A0ABN9CZJ1_9NEOB|nr:unnamed protein product [Staurois parvus]